MKPALLLLFALLGWMSLGTMGVILSLAHRRREEAIKQVKWIVGVFSAYLAALLAVSILQQQRTVPIGDDQCFGKMCFAVISVDTVPSLAAGDTGRFVRVGIRVSNQAGSADADGNVQAYLVDSKGRTWQPLPGLSGNRLTARVAAGSQMLSQPMFRVAQDSASLGLVFTHKKSVFDGLVIGDSDSFGHKRTFVPLGQIP